MSDQLSSNPLVSVGQGRTVDPTISQDHTESKDERETSSSNTTEHMSSQRQEIQLMLLEQQNRKRLLLARKEEDALRNTPRDALPPTASPTTATPAAATPTGFTPLSAINERTRLDYEAQLMLLEQQNKKRLLMARQEQDVLRSTPHYAKPPPAHPPTADRTVPMPAKRMKMAEQPHFNARGPSYSAENHCANDRDHQAMRVRVKELEGQNALLQDQLAQANYNSRQELPSRWVFLHRLSTGIYLDKPHRTKNVKGGWCLQSLKPVQNLRIYLEQQRYHGAAFAIICEYYTPFDRPKRPSESLESGEHSLEGVYPLSYSVHILCDVLWAAWCLLLDENKLMRKAYSLSCKEETMFEGVPMFNNAEVLFYHFLPCVQTNVLHIQESRRKRQLNLLAMFFRQNFEAEFDRANKLFAQGLVSGDTVKYLFKPGTILVSNQNECEFGYMQKSLATRDCGDFWVQAYSWEFDGSFKKVEDNLQVMLRGDNDWDQKETSIKSLSLFPLSYAGSNTHQKLSTRGQTFWRCRKPAYVSYTGLNMNRETAYVRHEYDPDEERLDEQTMASDEPFEGDAFLYLVPPTISGFDMQEKKWVHLRVDNIHPVRWNKEAFESLAIGAENKELIEALVSNKIAADKGTDMVRGKGNGLNILLHGGPGTGKTLTAEGMAEVAEKPLYRVSCGDIGTDPREVEEYLRKVFHLGKLWNCVVLLDEADVFLEQRTLSDLSRNALVSVFLHTLEYYDGILILTSNRVGVFDEAIISRIQLVLHYHDLTFAQRKQVWENFFRRLDTLGESVDTQAILASASELAKHEMNGRQIRNAVTTARQLALFKKEPMGVKHLEQSIKVSGNYYRYLSDVSEQMRDVDDGNTQMEWQDVNGSSITGGMLDR